MKTVYRKFPFRGLTVLTAICSMIFAGCSMERRHAILTFFFDGVPAPGGGSARKKSSSQYLSDDVQVTVTRLTMNYHKPYQENQCTKCHAENASLSIGERGRRGLCWTCHEHEEFKARIGSLPFVHGPAAVDGCSACHDPHESLQRSLLVLPDPKLCYSCHDREATLAGAHHASMESELCLTCHDPHGGQDRFFLARSVRAPSPRPQEAK